MSKYQDNLRHMMCLDIYLESLNDYEYQKIKQRIIQPELKPHSLMSWGIFNDHSSQLIQKANKEKEMIVLQKFQEKFDWKTNLKSILTNEYYALVLTNSALKIQWVNKNFSRMTGYPSNYALGKSPKFLQGKNTCQETQKRIKEQLGLNLPFTEVITNYKKNEEEYNCEVTIFPINNHQHQVTHYLALENKTF